MSLEEETFPEELSFLEEETLLEEEAFLTELSFLEEETFLEELSFLEEEAFLEETFLEVGWTTSSAEPWQPQETSAKSHMV